MVQREEGGVRSDRGVRSDLEICNDEGYDRSLNFLTMVQRGCVGRSEIAECGARREAGGGRSDLEKLND